MTDLDTVIRNLLVADATAEYDDFAEPMEALRLYSNALRAVLTWVSDAEEYGDQPDYSDARDIIAREIGVTGQ